MGSATGGAGGAAGWPAAAVHLSILSVIVGRASGARWFQRHSQTGAPAAQPDANIMPLAEAAERHGAAGDPFATFVAAHESALFAYLWRMTGDESAAYDLRQETFIRAWRRFDRVRGYERPLAWLYRVATNLALNERRDRRPSASLATIELDPAQSDPACRLAERDLVRETLLALPARERAALALREGQGFSCDELAQGLGVTPAAARTLLWRARDHFRELYARANTDTSENQREGGAQ
jgi:RNA polymerase sigma factor (sigma-70 family)